LPAAESRLFFPLVSLFFLSVRHRVNSFSRQPRSPLPFLSSFFPAYVPRDCSTRTVRILRVCVPGYSFYFPLGPPKSCARHQISALILFALASPALVFLNFCVQSTRKTGLPTIPPFSFSLVTFLACLKKVCPSSVVRNVGVWAPSRVPHGERSEKSPR